MPDLSPRQFTAYRGLLVDTGRAPESNDEVLDRLRPKGPDRTAYGRHWSTEPEVARNFATNPTAGGYETLPAGMRKFRGGQDKWGVVLEGRVHGQAMDSSVPYSEHEREIRVHHPDVDHPAANHLQGVTAHVYDMRSRQSLEEEFPHVTGQTGIARRRSDIFKAGLREPARSFEIPREHWA